MLNALLHSGVGDVAAVVTRYFGGTKLGTGGLVRAYTSCVQQALATLPLTERVELAAIELVVEYPRLAAVQQLFEPFEVRVLGQTFEADARFDLRLPKANLDAFRHAVLDATRGQARWSDGT
jgi:putative IMPACT (imprinted ancient) family translation regulator